MEQNQVAHKPDEVARQRVLLLMAIFGMTVSLAAYAVCVFFSSFNTLATLSAPQSIGKSVHSLIWAWLTASLLAFMPLVITALGSTSRIRIAALGAIATTLITNWYVFFIHTSLSKVPAIAACSSAIIFSLTWLAYAGSGQRPSAK